jgi:hypothetical protein
MQYFWMASGYIIHPITLTLIKQSINIAIILNFMYISHNGQVLPHFRFCSIRKASFSHITDSKSISKTMTISANIIKFHLLEMLLFHHIRHKIWFMEWAICIYRTAGSVLAQLFFQLEDLIQTPTYITQQFIVGLVFTG